MFSAIKFLTFMLSLIFFSASYANATENINSINILKSMFHNVSEAKNIKEFDKYYDKNFILESNGQTFNYTVYKKQQAEIFNTIKSLTILKYDDVFSSGDKVATRINIKLVKNSGEILNFYVILIAQIKNNKIYRMWELTYPGWNDKLPTGK